MAEEMKEEIYPWQKCEEYDEETEGRCIIFITTDLSWKECQCPLMKNNGTKVCPKRYARK